MKTRDCDDHLPSGRVYIHSTLWCSGKDLAFGARGPRFESGMGNFIFFFSIRSIIITLIKVVFSVGIAWVWLFPEVCTLHCKAGNGVS